MNFHELYENYYRAQVRGVIPPNVTGKDRPIIETLEKYSTADTTETKVRDSNTLAPRRGTKRKRSVAVAHSTANRRGVKTATKDIWKLIKGR